MQRENAVYVNSISFKLSCLMTQQIEKYLVGGGSLKINKFIFETKNFILKLKDLNPFGAWFCQRSLSVKLFLPSHHQQVLHYRRVPL